MNAAPHDLLLLAEGDDVLIAVRDLEPGAHRASTGSTVVVGEAVALGHKVAVRDIAAGEELTFDYRLVTEDEEDDDGTYACACGSARCRGTMLDR